MLHKKNSIERSKETIDLKSIFECSKGGSENLVLVSIIKNPISKKNVSKKRNHAMAKIIYSAKRRKIEFKKDDMKVMAAKLFLPCFYCGFKDAKGFLIGLDRFDNSGIYDRENTVPCCKICNIIKGKRNVEDFIEYMKKKSSERSDIVVNGPYDTLPSSSFFTDMRDVTGSTEKRHQEKIKRAETQEATETNFWGLEPDDFYRHATRVSSHNVIKQGTIDLLDTFDTDYVDIDYEWI